MTTHTFTKEQFIAFRDTFKRSAHNKAISAADLLLYNIVRGVEMDRGFTPITNTQKLAHQAADQGLRTAKTHLRYLMRYNKATLRARFGDMFTDEFQAEILTKI